MFIVLLIKVTNFDKLLELISELERMEKEKRI